MTARDLSDERLLTAVAAMHDALDPMPDGLAERAKAALPVLPVSGCAQTALNQALAVACDEIVIVAYGTPKPKGSLKHIGNGRMVEQVEGSKPWREKVAESAAITMRFEQRRTLDGPIAVEITVTVAKPKSAPKRIETWPTTRASGDSDKLARNILDAITDAKVIADDSRVIDLVCRKRYQGQHPDTLPAPGALIRVRPLGGAA